MDHNVHAGITQGLRNRGINCLTALEDSRASADDHSILVRAAELGRVVFTQDVDFLAIASERITSGNPFAGVIFASQMGITIGQAIADLELFAKVLDPEDMNNVLERIPL
jgi:predicted nuclease of predicted toxin-antitoxin system